MSRSLRLSKRRPFNNSYIRWLCSLLTCTARYQPERTSWANPEHRFCRFYCAAPATPLQRDVSQAAPLASRALAVRDAATVNQVEAADIGLRRSEDPGGICLHRRFLHHVEHADCRFRVEMSRAASYFTADLLR